MPATRDIACRVLVLRSLIIYAHLSIIRVYSYICHSYLYLSDLTIWPSHLQNHPHSIPMQAVVNSLADSGRETTCSLVLMREGPSVSFASPDFSFPLSLLSIPRLSSHTLEDGSSRHSPPQRVWGIVGFRLPWLSRAGPIKRDYSRKE